MGEPDEVLQHHQTLTLAMDRLQVLAVSCEEVLPTSRAAALMAHDLSEFGRRLLEHFTHEEDGGYMVAVVREHPHMENRIGNLQSDHRRLAGMLEAVIQQWNDEARRAQIKSTLDDFFAELRDHEQRENRLLQEAFCLDQGIGD